MAVIQSQGRFFHFISRGLFQTREGDHSTDLVSRLASQRRNMLISRSSRGSPRYFETQQRFPGHVSGKQNEKCFVVTQMTLADRMPGPHWICVFPCSEKTIYMVITTSRTTPLPSPAVKLSADCPLHDTESNQPTRRQPYLCGSNQDMFLRGAFSLDYQPDVEHMICPLQGTSPRFVLKLAGVPGDSPSLQY